MTLATARVRFCRSHELDFSSDILGGKGCAMGCLIACASVSKWDPRVLIKQRSS